MNTTRRTALAMLGLAPATTVGAETFLTPAPPDEPVRAVCSAYETETFAKAFENLAAELRSNRVDIEHLNLSASMGPNDLAGTHDLHLRFRYKPEA